MRSGVRGTSGLHLPFSKQQAETETICGCQSRTQIMNSLAVACWPNCFHWQKVPTVQNRGRCCHVRSCYQPCAVSARVNRRMCCFGKALVTSMGRCLDHSEEQSWHCSPSSHYIGMERLQNSSLTFSRSKNGKKEGESPVMWISRVGAVVLHPGVGLDWCRHVQHQWCSRRNLQSVLRAQGDVGFRLVSPWWLTFKHPWPHRPLFCEGFLIFSDTGWRAGW